MMPLEDESYQVVSLLIVRWKIGDWEKYASFYRDKFGTANSQKRSNEIPITSLHVRALLQK